MSTQAERATAISHASEALGDPADFFETHTVKGKPATAPGIAGAFGRTVEAEQEEKTSQVFARDLIAVAEWIVAGSPVPLSGARERLRSALTEQANETDSEIIEYRPGSLVDPTDFVNGRIDLDYLARAVINLGVD